MYKVEKEMGGRLLSIETGRLARQAHGAVSVRYGDTVVMVTAVAGNEVEEQMDFVPFTVEYRERMHAAGKIPGGPYYRREGRPTQKEVLTARMIDRPIRPLLPKGYRRDTQVAAIVLSADKENDPDILAGIGASAALSLSPVPFDGPIGVVRVGRVDGEFVLNPTHNELGRSELDMVVCGTRSDIVMVEAGAKEVKEEIVVEALGFARKYIASVVELQEELIESVGVEKEGYEPLEVPEEVFSEFRQRVSGELERALTVPTKKERRAGLERLRERVLEDFGEEHSEISGEIFELCFEKLEREILRRMALEGRRCDGRGLDDVREINCEVGVLPRTHGSALFVRGETQALVVATLGTGLDEEIVDGLYEEYARSFMFHYYFPPFSTGEVKPFRGPSRREIGHGALAERALQPVMPHESRFPYTTRVVSEILESNGSSSMASVCGGSLALMDAGVPVSAAVGGIAMGLIKEGDEVRILTDILGDEDKCGDLDFKVAGSADGITALQMDTKTAGMVEEILLEALLRAREARFFVLEKMGEALGAPRPEISPYAPKLLQMKVDPDKLGLVIGTAGRTIKRIEQETGVTIEVEQDGTITISSVEPKAAEKAEAQIKAIVEEPEAGRVYPEAVVTELKPFGAIVEIAPGKDGLVHISELDEGYVRDVKDVVKVGDRIPVKVLSIDPMGRIRLSRKQALRDSSDGRKPRK